MNTLKMMNSQILKWWKDEMLNLSSRKADGKPANYEYWLWLIPLKKYEIVSNIIKLAYSQLEGSLLKIRLKNFICVYSFYTIRLLILLLEMRLPVSKGHRPVLRDMIRERADTVQGGNSTTLIVGYSSGLELVTYAQYRPVVDNRRATRSHKHCYVFWSFSIRLKAM